MDTLTVLGDLLSPGWVGSAIGLAGILVAVLTYRRSLVGARLVFMERDLRLLSVKGQALPGEIEIRYRGALLDRLTKTDLVLWNAGRLLLRGQDVVAEDPVRFCFEGQGTILSASIAKTTRTTNAIQLAQTDDKTITIGFDYLDPGDGVVIEVLHTFLKAGPRHLGTIRGVPQGLMDLGRLQVTPAHRMSTTRLARMFRQSASFAMFLGFGAVLFAALLPESALRASTVVFGLLAILAGGSYGAFGRRVPPTLRLTQPGDA